MQWVENELPSTQLLVPPIICMRWKYQSLSWSNTSSFYSYISHPLPLSLEEQEWGRTRKRRWRWNGDGGGRWSEGKQSKAIISSRSSHPYLMIMVSSWALTSLVEDFSQTLISISHACMNHGVWWPLTHLKRKMCSTPYHGACYLMNPNLGVSFLTQSHVLVTSGS